MNFINCSKVTKLFILLCFHICSKCKSHGDCNLFIILCNLIIDTWWHSPRIYFENSSSIVLQIQQFVLMNITVRKSHTFISMSSNLNKDCQWYLLSKDRCEQTIALVFNNKYLKIWFCITRKLTKMKQGS